MDLDELLVFEHLSCIKYWGSSIHTHFIDAQDDLVGKTLILMMCMSLSRVQLLWETVFLCISVTEVLCHDTGLIHLHFASEKKQDGVCLEAIASFLFHPLLPLPHPFYPYLLPTNPVLLHCAPIVVVITKMESYYLPIASIPGCWPPYYKFCMHHLMSFSITCIYHCMHVCMWMYTCSIPISRFTVQKWALKFRGLKWIITYLTVSKWLKWNLAAVEIHVWEHYPVLPLHSSSHRKPGSFNLHVSSFSSL